MTLNTIILSYFVVQAGLLWLVLCQKWPLSVRLTVVSWIVALGPIVLLLNGAREQFGDGGAVNNILVFVALVGGVAITATVLLTRWVVARLPKR